MERRASLVLAVLVQSTVQFHLGGDHYLRPEGLKVSSWYRESTSEFMDFDPGQNYVGGSLFRVDFPAAVGGDMQSGGGPVLLVENDIEEVKFDDPEKDNTIMIESFITEEIEEPEGAGLEGEEREGRLRRDAGYVDGEFVDFAPRRLRGGRMRL